MLTEFAQVATSKALDERDKAAFRNSITKNVPKNDVRIERHLRSGRENGLPNEGADGFNNNIIETWRRSITNCPIRLD
jgi:hypothetical protein